MGALAELLELLHGVHGRLSSFEAEYRDWSQPRPSRKLVVDRSDIANGRFRGRWTGAGPWPAEIVATRRFWLQRPDRLRTEVLRNHELVRLGVRSGAQWWRWDRAEGASTGEASMHGGDVGTLPPLLSPPLLDPVRLLAELCFEPAGVGERSGRKVLRARARRRREPSSRDNVSYEFEFDAEHGTMLRRAVLEDDQCVQLSETLEVRYDEAIDPARFVFVSPDGKQAMEIEVPGAARANARHALGPQEADGHGHGPALAQPLGTLWLTGLPAAGKTTLAHAVERDLARTGRVACVLDSHVLRSGLSSDLGLSRGDRAEQARRTAHVAALVSKAGVVAIVALVSPYAYDRRRAREVHEEAGLPFFEVWVDTPVSVCKARGAKGLYAHGELDELTGMEAPYEPPSSPELRVRGDGEEPGTAARLIAGLLPAGPERAVIAAARGW